MIGDLVEKMDAKVSGVVEKLWLVSASQSDEAKAYCFDNDKCGKVMIGGVRIDGIPFFACQTACCPYLKDELEMGEFILPYTGQRDLVVRKLTAVGE